MVEIFNIVLYEESYRITIGKQIVTSRAFNTKKEAEEYINAKPWELIINTQLVTATHAYENYINNNLKNQENEKNT